MTSGASNDIERATEIAQKMVCEYGMSPLGPLMFRKSAGNAWDGDRAAGLSEDTARRVDDEVRTIVMRGYETARQILQHHRPAMTAVAEQLLEVESLDGGELKAIVDRFATRVN
jgi:cell division protease FtsH